MLVIGVTGGIGAGKSTVSGMMAALGARVLDADAIAREVLRNDAGLLQELVRAFGEDILAPDGSLRRRELGCRAFRDRRSRERLNGLLHPPILARTRELLEQIRRSGYDGIVVLDAALLVECQALYMIDRLVVVTAPEKLRSHRLQNDRGISDEEFRARAAAQLPPAEKIKQADVVIVNDGTREDLRRQVQKAWTRLLQDAHGDRFG